MLCIAMPSALAWDGWGHRLVANIAKEHLTPKARAEVQKYLGEEDMESAAVWMDRVASWTKKRKGHIPGYYVTSSWHTYTVGRDLKPSNARGYKGSGDLLPNLGRCIERLKNRHELSDSAVVTNLRCVLHMVGDMHCPSHAYYLEFRYPFGGPSPVKGSGVPSIRRNDQRVVYYNGKKTTYHTVWDGQSLRAVYPQLGRDLTAFRRELDTWSPAQIKKVCKGTIEDWAAENAKQCRPIYDWIEALDHRIDTSFLVEHRALSEMQVRKAAYRLAHVLNECFK